MVTSMSAISRYGPTPANDPYLVHVGNVHATADWLVTPAGSWPLADVNVTTADQTSTTTHTPTWAVVMVIVFIWFFLLSLLFLLARETRVSGYVAIHVQSGAQSFTDQIGVSNAFERAEVLRRAAYLQLLIGRARHNRGYTN